MAEIPITLLPRPRKIDQRLGTFRPVPSIDPANPLPTVRVVTDPAIAHPQGYRLVIAPTEITVAATGGAGTFYASQTLRQLLRQFPTELPCLEIDDYPDFGARGAMLDISRDKVPTMATLFALVDRLAEWKINQLQLYTEHTFAYARHERVWQTASPMTADEIRALDDYCKARFIELVPNQNSFGHMERWLKHADYQHLAEAIDGADTPWDFRWKGPFSLCPTDPASVDFLRGLYSELLPNFSSSHFNVGCDETFDIGQGRSKAECERRGVTRVYLDFLAKVNELARSHGRTMMFWGDIIVQKPELIGELPKDVIALEWGYEADHAFDRDGEGFARAGIPFYVCPGTSSWNSIAGRTENTIANLKSAAESGLKHGAIGYLITDWGDNGHLQYLPISYLGFAAGAAYSWCSAANRDLDIVLALNTHVFEDTSGVMGRVACDMGNVYRVCEKNNRNGSALFRLMIPPPSDAHPERSVTPAELDAAESAIANAIANAIGPLPHARSSRPDAELIADEFGNAAAILRHAVKIGRAKLSRLPDATHTERAALLAAEHRRLWLARNRPGGLEDSVQRLT